MKRLGTRVNNVEWIRAVFEKIEIKMHNKDSMDGYMI